MVHFSALSLAFALAVTGCYSAARPSPTRPDLPKLADGEQIDLDTRSVRYWSDARVAWVERDVIHRMRYQDKNLTYMQLRSLADPTWNDKLAAYDKLAEKCRHADVPRYVGYGSIAAGAATYAGGSALLGNASVPVGLALLGVGVVAYTAGYLAFGGLQCRQAELMADELHFGDANDTDLTASGTIDEITDIVKDFNKRVAAGPATAPGTETETDSTDAAPSE